MSKNSIYSKKFKEALLNGADKLEVGDFVFFREKANNGIGILTKEAFAIKLKATTKAQMNSFNKKREQDKVALKTWKPNPIREEDLPEWLR